MSLWQMWDLDLDSPLGDLAKVAIDADKIFLIEDRAVIAISETLPSHVSLATELRASERLGFAFSSAHPHTPSPPPSAVVLPDTIGPPTLNNSIYLRAAV